MIDTLLYYSIFWAIGFLGLGIYLRLKFKDRFDDLNK